MLKSLYNQQRFEDIILHFNIKNLVSLFLSFILMTSISASAIEEIKIEKDSSLSLNDCIKIALQNSPNIKRYRYNYGVSKSNVGRAKSAYFPTIGVGTGYNLSDTNTNRNSSNSKLYTAEASLNQLIWNFGKTNANIRMQKFNLITALFNFDDNVLDTIYQVRTNYYGVLAARAAVDINKAYVDINERNYQRTKAYFEEGIKSKIDLVNAEVNLSDSKVTLVNAVKTYKNSMVTLNNSMYVAHSPDYELLPTETFKYKENLYMVNLEELDKKSDLSVLPENVSDAMLTAKAEKAEILTDYKFEAFPYTFEKSVELAYANRPDLKAYDATLKAMEENLLYIKREFYPEISARAGYGYRDLNATNSFNVGINVSSNVNILSKKHEIDAGKLQIALAQNEINLLKQNVYFEVQNAYINMIELEKQIPLLAVKVRQTLENFELADGRYFVGLGDYIELQDAKVKYNNAQHTFVEAIYKYNVARANLEKAIALPQEISISIEDIN